MTDINCRYGIPLQKPALPDGLYVVAKSDIPESPPLDDASTLAVELFAAAVKHAEILELSRCLVKLLNAIEGSRK